MRAFQAQRDTFRAGLVRGVEREDLGEGAAIITLHDGTEHRVEAAAARQLPDMSFGSWYLIETSPGGGLRALPAELFELLFVPAEESAETVSEEA